MFKLEYNNLNIKRDTMREINTSVITDTVAKLCINSNIYLNNDIKEALIKGISNETALLPKNILNILVENADVAYNTKSPICQDTGMAIVYFDIGQDVHVVGGNVTDAINAGVALGYEKGYLRKSVVGNPLTRINTKDNTPAIIHYNIVEGSNIDITVSPKGFGSENMSRLKMLMPSAGLQGIKDFAVETVKLAGSNACPPLIVGIGIGGTMEKCATLAKKGLLRNVGTDNPDPMLDGIEKDLLEEINKLNIGPVGFGGKTTALAVHIEVFATHIAGLPVCVNTGCHVTRHAFERI